ncbi:hypothetical protein RJ55_05001 [Drechmeria coniospora]|nr:hypothetical protein RJ55_05001 [Drechmeria coniospora]
MVSWHVPLSGVLLALWHAAGAARGHSDADAGTGGSFTACRDACQNCLQSVRFDDADPTSSPSEQSCRSLLALSSLYLCWSVHCGGHEGASEAVEAWNATCVETYSTSLPALDDVLANYTDDDVARLRQLSRNDSLVAGPPLSEAVIPSSSHFRVWHETLLAVEYVAGYHGLYGIAMPAFWVCVVAVGVVHRLLCAPSRSDGGWGGGVVLRSANVWFSRTLAIPNTFGHRRNVWGDWGTMPPRLQSLTLLLFLLLNVALSMHGYRIIEENYYFPTRTRQVLRYLSDRTGILAFFNFPVIWLFGMRNDVCLWLTGWDFGTYNAFHRWVARIATAQAVVHSVCYTILISIEGGWSYYLSYYALGWWNYGVVATVAMSLLLPLSWCWFRRHHYETFLVVHMALGLVLLLTMLGHVSIFGGRYDALFYVPACVWLLDRVLRAFRVLFFRRAWSVDGLASYDASANMVRLTVPMDEAAYEVKAGTYFYLMLLDSSRPWQSHPFTVASVSGRPSRTSLGEQVPLLDLEEVDATDAASDVDGGEATRPHMTFLIRPYDGLTKQLRHLAAATEWSAPVPLRVLLDGPYGRTQNLEGYDLVVFLVGGSGVVTALSYLPTLTQADGGRQVQVHLVVREPALAEDVIRRDMGDALGCGGLTVDVYISSRAGVAAGGTLAGVPSNVRQHLGRPNADEVVRRATASVGRGSLAVVASGPQRLQDEARRAVVEALARSASRISYFEESFAW